MDDRNLLLVTDPELKTLTITVDLMKRIGKSQSGKSVVAGSPAWTPLFHEGRQTPFLFQTMVIEQANREDGLASKLKRIKKHFLTADQRYLFERIEAYMNGYSDALTEFEEWEEWDKK
jgi:hypothetical protein